MNSTAEQPDLFAPRSVKPGPAQTVSLSKQNKLRQFLLAKGCWQTRRQICEHFRWPARTLRDAAESLGADIVRCQSGYKLTEQITRDDLDQVKQAVDHFQSQAKRMFEYSQSLRLRLHALIG